MSARNLVLILIFGGLFYGMYALYRSQTRRPLQADLIALDTARISQIQLHPRDGSSRLIRLQRAEGHWIASNGQVHLRALKGPVSDLLANLTKITTIDIAAKSESEWPSFGLGPGQGRRITVFVDNEAVEDFWVGYTRAISGSTDSIAYLHLHEETEVYTVRGLSSGPFHQSFQYFRPKRVLMLPADHPVDSFSIELPDTVLHLQRTTEGWLVNGQLPTDATSIRRYLDGLRRLEADIFVDDFDGQNLSRDQYRRLTFYLQAQEQPILIESYEDTLREYPFILRSSQNPGTWFGSDSSGILPQLFPDWQELLVPEER